MKTYGLLGRNISYSLSPGMHNAAFKALRFDAEYILFDTKKNQLRDFFSRLKSGSIAGCNVTIPYKEEALRFVNDCSAATKVIGALNTVVVDGGVLKGYNTDYQGFMKALRGFNEGDLNFKADNKNAFVFGAGGAAKAVIQGLLTLGVKKIIIADVDTERAERLADVLGESGKHNATIAVAHDAKQHNDFISRSDILVNATPCGMKENDPELFNYAYIHERLYVFDLIYARETQLIKKAKSQAAKVSNGLNMLLYQAARSLEYWTGKDAPLDVMRGALPERMHR